MEGYSDIGFYAAFFTGLLGLGSIGLYVAFFVKQKMTSSYEITEKSVGTLRAVPTKV